MQTVEIQILGRKYYLKSDDPDKLKARAQYLEEKLEELNRKFNTVDQTKLFVLYTLILLEDYLSDKAEIEDLKKEFQQITEVLKKIDDEF